MDTGSAPHAAGVSAREAEVLSGMAEHLTNAEIAERLFISVRTAAALPAPLTPFVGRVAERAALGCGLELFDAYQMAAETAIAAGDLPAARELAEHIRDMPFYREEGHLATARLLVVTALAGDWDETAAFGQRFREGWERFGRPRAGNLSRGPYAAPGTGCSPRRSG